METKSFVLGAACGSVLTAGVMWFVGTSENETTQTLSHETAAGVSGEPSPSAGPAEETQQPKILATEASGSNTMPLSNTPEGSDNATAIGHIGDTGESDATSDIQPEGQRSTPSSAEQKIFERWAELQSEPRDDAWSYYIEQAISQFLGGYPTIGEFDINHIECRATRCQIQVTGFDGSTWATWSRIMYDMNQQPWAEFYESASESYDTDGRFVILQRLRRETE